MYDAVGNLTNVVYPVSPAISLSYDALNRLTNMVDAVGTTVLREPSSLSRNTKWQDSLIKVQALKQFAPKNRFALPAQTKSLNLLNLCGRCSKNS